MTTAICREEAAVAELLGIPDTHAVATLIALGHPQEVVTKLRRDAGRGASRSSTASTARRSQADARAARNRTRPEEGGDPACWAHLFDDGSAGDDDVEGDGAVGAEGEALLDVAGARRPGDEDPA